MPIPKSEQRAETQKLKVKVRLGLNVVDLMRVNDELRPKVIKTGQFRLNHPISLEEEGDERFVELMCDLLVGAKLVDFIRNEGRLSRSTIPRAYIKKGDSPWVKLPYTAILTDKEGDSYSLSDKEFPVEIEAAPFVPKPVERVLGRKKA